MTRLLKALSVGLLFVSFSACSEKGTNCITNPFGPGCGGGGGGATVPRDVGAGPVEMKDTNGNVVTTIQVTQAAIGLNGGAGNVFYYWSDPPPARGFAPILYFKDGSSMGLIALDPGGFYPIGEKIVDRVEIPGPNGTLGILTLKP